MRPRNHHRRGGLPHQFDREITIGHFELMKVFFLHELQEFFKPIRRLQRSSPARPSHVGDDLRDRLENLGVDRDLRLVQPDERNR